MGLGRRLQYVAQQLEGRELGNGGRFRRGVEDVSNFDVEVIIIRGSFSNDHVRTMCSGSFAYGAHS